MGKNAEEVIKPTILFLRPFWAIDVTAKQLKKIHKITKRFGKLIALLNKSKDAKHSEHTKLRLIGDENIWARHCTFLGNLYDYLNPPLNLSLIEVPDETWQKHCIEEMQKADIVIVHLAPTSPDLQEFTPMQPERTPSPELDFGHNPVHESITRHGLLRELDYCKQAKAFHKTIVLIPNSFLHRIFEALEIGDITQSGQWYRKTNAGLVALTPKLSTLDRALTVLNDVRSVIPYNNFGDRLFSVHLHQELSLCIESLRQQDLSTSLLSHANIVTGIQSKPVRLPPGDELKHIRFTPVEKLTKIPRGEIVELSFDEVKKLKPDLASELESSELKCPSCGRGLECMFWYQYGLEPSSSGEIYMRCQYDGHDDHV